MGLPCFNNFIKRVLFIPGSLEEKDGFFERDCPERISGKNL